MNQRNKILLTLLLLQTVVIVGMRAADSGPQRFKPLPLIDGFTAKLATKLTLEGAPDESGKVKEKLVLAKKGSDWVIESAEDFPAKKSEVEDLLETLERARVQTPVLAKSTYHAKLEVADEKFQRRLTVAFNGEERVLLFGTSPAFKSIHVRRAGEDAVYQLSDVSTGDVAPRAWNWVERAYVDHPESNVWSLHIKNAKDSIRLEKNPDTSAWQVAGLDAVKRSAIDELVNKARAINLEEPVGRTLKPEYGLDNPAAMVTLVTGTSTIAGVPPKTTETTEIAIGAKDAEKSRYYVKASSSDFVVSVAGWALDPLLDKTTKDLAETDATP